MYLSIHSSSLRARKDCISEDIPLRVCVSGLEERHYADTPFITRSYIQHVLLAEVISPAHHCTSALSTTSMVMA